MASMQTKGRGKRSRSAEPALLELSKKAKTESKDPMALFCTTVAGIMTGYLVPIRLLPPLEVVNEDIERRGSKHQRLYHRGREVPLGELTKKGEVALRREGEFGCILRGCIVPQAVRTLSFDEGEPLTASVQCEFFACISEEC